MSIDESFLGELVDLNGGGSWEHDLTGDPFPSDPECGQDVFLFNVLMDMRRRCLARGYAEKIAVEIVHAFVTKKDGQPWTDELALAKVRHVYESYDNTPYREMWDDFDAAREAEATRAKAEKEASAWLPLDEELKTVEQRRPYIVKYFGEVGVVTQVFAPSFSGKSTIVVDMAVSAVLGESWGGQRVRPCRAVYFAPEDRYGVRMRVKANLLQRGVSPSEIADRFFIPPVNRLDLFDLDKVKELVRDIESNTPDDGLPMMVVIDTQSKASTAIEDSAEQMSQVFANAEGVAVRCNAWVVLLHHTGHNNQHRTRGSSVQEGAVETSARISMADEQIATWTFKKTKNGGIRTGATRTFQIVAQEMGIDEDDDPITAAVALDITHVTRRPEAEERHEQTPEELMFSLVKASGVRTSWSEVQRGMRAPYRGNDTLFEALVDDCDRVSWCEEPRGDGTVRYIWRVES